MSYLTGRVVFCLSSYNHSTVRFHEPKECMNEQVISAMSPRHRVRWIIYMYSAVCTGPILSDSL